ncbi:hypothetical protein BN7_3176 [Wickerhamomyces ciferrii]|uniref:Uncharacterized protein n=1 Tax=Wickerhamomyces ciferrii (strain ATCC 14091 / BCRC 22168 / CBS 111 / JCM 3599 / NBRC 0793 / NRRL Y-1031 F-60-10) TaxID=1206466 RepID=K0KQS7_WICCF|nr:uncharacterized protein BN7_3176 [Wickerhamomyces ciferrii]CCH43623.1 hypothetical protein BN7_3176 [Wickerhamomyces ciferrii]
MHLIAITVIKWEFCIPRRSLDSEIVKRLHLKKDERPRYFSSLWKLYVAVQIVYEPISNNAPKTAGGHKVSNTSISDNGIIFSDAFKAIRFQSVGEIKDDEFARNILELELFIEYSLNKIAELDSVDVLYQLLNTLDILHTDNLLYSGLSSNSKKYRQDAMNSFIITPIIRFIRKLLWVHAFYNIQPRSTDTRKKTRPSVIWDSLNTSGEPYPKTLRDEEMFHLHAPDFLITLRHSNASTTPVCGIDLEGSELHGELELNEHDNFTNLSKVFRRIAPKQLLNKFSSYIISDFTNSIYFEYPLGTGEWWSDNEEDVYITGAPLRFKLLNSNGDTSADSISLQLLLMLKLYDTIRRVLPMDTWLKDFNGTDILNKISYRLLDEGCNEDVFNPFIISQFRYGFKKNVAVEKMEKPLKSHLGYVTNDTGNGRKRLTVEQLLFNDTSLSEGITSGSDRDFDTKKLFPTHANLKISNYTLLSEYSNNRGTKLIVEGPDLFKGNTNVSNKVFFKMFDLANSRYLHEYVIDVGMPYTEEQYEKFTDSEINIMSSLKEYSKDFKDIVGSIKKSYIREVTALRRINQWNSTHGIEEQVNSPRLLQYGWANLELLTEDGQLHYSYWGPFICTECFEFINDNELENHPKRIKNLRNQVKLLSNAGISHNDLREDNICFDQSDVAYLVDFDHSIVDGNKYLEKYDFERIDPHEKCC